MKKQLVPFLFLVFTLVSCSLFAQQQDYIFNDRRVINSHSTEVLGKRQLDFRVGHRFGDMLGDAGGWQSFYGLENSSDISIGIEGGITDHINIGIHRTKGSGELRQNVNLFAKARIMQQSKEKNNPMSITVLGMSTISTMPNSESENVLSHFDVFAHRVSYHFQIMIARKFGERFSLQGSVNYTHRNQVFTYDQNELPSLGVAGKIQITKAFGFLFDANFAVLDQSRDLRYYYPIGVGFELETGGGHIFQINLTNAKGLSETDFIPYTNSNWTEGQFRLGFTIARKFKV